MPIEVDGGDCMRNNDCPKDVVCMDGTCYEGEKWGNVATKDEWYRKQNMAQISVSLSAIDKQYHKFDTNYVGKSVLSHILTLFDVRELSNMLSDYSDYYDHGVDKWIRKRDALFLPADDEKYAAYVIDKVYPDKQLLQRELMPLPVGELVKSELY